MRLCCKAYADIGQTYLFQDFEFRLLPNYHRLHQLEQLAFTPDIAAKLQCISFQSGVPLEYADYRYWQAQTCHEISSDWAQALAARGASNDDYEVFHSSLQARFTPDMPQRYTLYRWHFDQEAALVADHHIQIMLRRTLNVLYQHNSSVRFKIVMNEPKITLEDLEQFDITKYQSERPEDTDPRRRVFNRRKNCLDHFLNFLEAANSSEFGISDFTAVDVPHNLLSTDSLIAQSVMNSTFRNLRKADIKVDSFPHSDWLSRGSLRDIYLGGRNIAARRLRQILDLPPNLEDLRLEFPQGKEAEYSFDLFDRTNIDRFPRLWMPHLKSLDLCRFRCSWNDLQAFLAEGKNLESLTLSYCRLETGSMIDLLHFVPSMKLRQLSIEGIWYSDEDSGEWHSHTTYDFNTCFAATTYEGPYVRNGLRSKIEEFMLKGGDCPLPRWTVHGREEDIWEVQGDTSWHYLPGLPRQ